MPEGFACRRGRTVICLSLSEVDDGGYPRDVGLEIKCQI